MTVTWFTSGCCGFSCQIETNSGGEETWDGELENLVKGLSTAFGGCVTLRKSYASSEPPSQPLGAEAEISALPARQDCFEAQMRNQMCTCFRYLEALKKIEAIITIIL